MDWEGGGQGGRDREGGIGRWTGREVDREGGIGRGTRSEG